MKTSLFNSLEPGLEKRLTSRRDLIFQSGRMAAVYGSVPVAVGLLSTRVFGSELPEDIIAVLNFALTLEFLEDEHYKAGLGKSGLIPDSDRKVFETISKHETAHVELLKKVIGDKAVAKPQLDPTAGGAFPDALSNYQTYLALSQAFEDTGVRAYKGQAGNLMSNGKILTTALQIHSVEARHASQLRRMRKEKGWITADSRGDLPAATQAVYDGEGNTRQGTVDITSLFMGDSSSSAPPKDHKAQRAAVSSVSVPASAISEAFDEPLTKEQVLAIVKPFIRE